LEREGVSGIDVGGRGFGVPVAVVDQDCGTVVVDRSRSPRVDIDLGVEIDRVSFRSRGALKQRDVHRELEAALEGFTECRDGVFEFVESAALAAAGEMSVETAREGGERGEHDVPFPSP
jgi:hypothetical protein